MVELFGKSYYIDIDGITEKCRTGNQIKEEDGSETTEINIFKYEIIKMCLERVLNEFNEADEELGAFAQNGTSPSFKIAFNTLIKNEILIEEDE
jgi:fructose-1-phosphate kinase PfkB-like protein